MLHMMTGPLSFRYEMFVEFRRRYVLAFIRFPIGNIDRNLITFILSNSINFIYRIEFSVAF